MSRAILTGGGGLIGSHVGEALLEAGHSVAIIDDRNDFYDPAIKTANIAGLAKAGATRLFGMRAVCLRFFTVYGPRQRPDLVIHRFYRLMRAGEAIPVYGDGTTGRDDTFIQDIVQAVLASVALDAAYEVINLGGARPVLLKNLIQVLGAVLGVNPRILEFPAQPGDVPITWADTGKVGRLLGYTPRVGFDHGIRIFHNWYESVQSGSCGTILADPLQPQNGTLSGGVNLN